jgi:hypothetical protein
MRNKFHIREGDSDEEVFLLRFDACIGCHCIRNSPSRSVSAPLPHCRCPHDQHSRFLSND